MPVDDGNRRVIGNADVVRLYADKLAVLCVGGVDGDGAACEAGLVEKPEVGKGGQEGTRDVACGGEGDVGEGVVEDEDGQERPGGEEVVDDHDCVYV